MRLLLLTAVTLAALGGCKGNEKAQENQAVEDSLTANSIVANDITAIDAVTADAANMAADVDINFTNDQVLYNGSGSAPSSSRATSAADSGARPGRTAPRPVAEESRPPTKDRE
jgi:hypothetical protein